MEPAALHSSSGCSGSLVHGRCFCDYDEVSSVVSSQAAVELLHLFCVSCVEQNLNQFCRRLSCGRMGLYALCSPTVVYHHDRAAVVGVERASMYPSQAAPGLCHSLRAGAEGSAV